jgi:hypothetical protein
MLFKKYKVSILSKIAGADHHEIEPKWGNILVARH